MRNGRVFGQVTSALPIDESDSSFWPTPMTRDARGPSRGKRAQGSPPLAQAVKLWPTPDASCANEREAVETFKERQAKLRAKGINGNGCGTPLGIAVKLWPTPTCGDAKASGAAGYSTETRHAGTTLVDAAVRQPNAGGVLNPAWVETLMGCPPGWTDGPPVPERRRKRGSPRARS
nr:hypothetical protein [Polyangium fumosum]